MKKNTLITFMLLLISNVFYGQTLAAGDIAFIGFNTDTPDSYTWIALKDIPAGEVIYFTEDGWYSGAFGIATESHYSWTSPVGGTPIGTIVSISESSVNVLSASSGTISSLLAGTSFNLSGGDQMLAYYSTSGANTTTVSDITFIAGVHADYNSTCFDSSTSWNPASCADGTAESIIPPGLTNGVNAVSLYISGAELDNSKYNGTLTGDANAIRALINNRANWTGSDTAGAISIGISDFPTPAITPAAAPTITNVTIPNAASNVGDMITVTITASEAGLSLNTGQVNGVNVTGFSDDGGGSYSATYTVTEGNTDRAAGDDIPVNFILSNGGVNSDAFTTAISQNADAIDANSPTVTGISIPNSSAKVGDAITVIIVANEAGLSINTGQVNGVNITGFTNIAGGTYSATYTVAEGNIDRAAGDNIPVNFILTDTAGNNSTAFTTAISQNADAIDANSPTVTGISIPNASAKVGDAITVTITATDTGLSLNTGTINGVNITGFTENSTLIGGNYSATYTVTEGNTDRAAGDDIPINFILTDSAGNNSTAFTTAISQNADAINANSPTITSVAIPNASAKVGDAVTVTIIASEAGLTINTGQVNGVNVTSFTNISGNTYTATYTVSEGNTDRAAGDDIPVNFILTDSAGNNSTAFTTAISQNADAIDANSPTVTSVSVPANATYITGQNLDFTVNFNENITVNTTGGTPQITITIGSTTRQATYMSGSGSSALLFRYTVQSGDLDTDGVSIGVLTTNSGMLTDTVGNNANLTLNSVGSTIGVLVGYTTYTWQGDDMSDPNDWNVAENWDTNQVPNSTSNIIIPNTVTNYPTASSAVTFDAMTIQSGASFIPEDTVTGTVTFVRNIPTTNWYLVAPPLSGETYQNLIGNHTFASGTGGNIGLAPYNNNSSSSWDYSNGSTTGNLTSGIGSSIKLAGTGNLSFTGSALHTDVAPLISNGSNDSFNLIGNPFTAYINSDEFLTTNTSALSESTIWLWDGSQYVTKNSTSSFEIAPAQGFFVEKATTGSPSVTFTAADRSHAADTFMRQEANPSFKLFAESNATERSTEIFYIDGKTAGFDNGYDSKIFGGASENFSIYTELLDDNDGRKLAIQTLPSEGKESYTIPVGLTAKAGEEVTFSINTTNLDDLSVYLEDKNTGVLTNLSEEDYKVTLTEDVDDTGNFYVTVSGKSLSSNDSIASSNISIYKSSNTQLTFSGIQGEAKVTLYSLTGGQVYNTTIISNGSSTVDLPNLSTGVYIVKLSSENGSKTQKIIFN